MRRAPSYAPLAHTSGNAAIPDGIRGIFCIHEFDALSALKKK